MEPGRDRPGEPATPARTRRTRTALPQWSRGVIAPERLSIQNRTKLARNLPQWSRGVIAPERGPRAAQVRHRADRAAMEPGRDRPGEPRKVPKRTRN